MRRIPRPRWMVQTRRALPPSSRSFVRVRWSWAMMTRRNQLAQPQDQRERHMRLSGISGSRCAARNPYTGCGALHDERWLHADACALLKLDDLHAQRSGLCSTGPLAGEENADSSFRCWLLLIGCPLRRTCRRTDSRRGSGRRRRARADVRPAASNERRNASGENHRKPVHANCVNAPVTHSV